MDIFTATIVVAYFVLAYIAYRVFGKCWRKLDETAEVLPQNAHKQSRSKRKKRLKRRLAEEKRRRALSRK